MSKAADSANVVMSPPIVWALAFIAGLGAGWFYPMPFVPPSFPHVLTGIGVFIAGLLLAGWAAATIRRAGTQLDAAKATSAIVMNGPFRFSRNPIYAGMVLGQIGLATGFNNLWILASLVPFYFVMRYGVIAREESYLQAKFGNSYLSYKSQVRRWL